MFDCSTYFVENLKRHNIIYYYYQFLLLYNTYYDTILYNNFFERFYVKIYCQPFNLIVVELVYNLNFKGKVKSVKKIKEKKTLNS